MAKAPGFSDPALSAEEQALLDEPVEELCRRINDWDVQQQCDLPPDIWDFIKKQRFFGMIIPKEYGGLGFSAIGHARVITRIASQWRENETPGMRFIRPYPKACDIGWRLHGARFEYTGDDDVEHRHGNRPHCLGGGCFRD